MKPSFANPAELAILAVADSYVAKCHRVESEPFATAEAAQAEGERLALLHRRGATVYGRGILHGQPCGALHSSYSPRLGWQLNK